jgi:Amt family ammonium transporter
MDSTGIAGVVGLIFNALFAADYIIGLDGVSTGVINGGWINHNYRQLYVQIAYVLACMGYSFVVSAILAYVINFIPGLHLRASEEAELLGMDDDQLGEFAYDYVEIRRNYNSGFENFFPATEGHSGEPGEHIVSPQHGSQEHSNMIHGTSPDSSSSGGNAHTTVMGDRHGVAAEDKLKEKVEDPNGA